MEFHFLEGALNPRSRSNLADNEREMVRQTKRREAPLKGRKCVFSFPARSVVSREGWNRKNRLY